MHMSRSRPDSRDAGYTLVELLVVIVVLGIIMVPLANVVIGYFLDSASISARLSESHDEQITAAYWQQDVSSIGVRSTDYDPVFAQTFPFTRSVGTPLNFPCTGTTGTTKTVIAWNQYDTSGNPTQISVAYLVSGNTLVRASCTGSGGTATLTTVAHLLYLDASHTVTVTCYAADGSSNACDGTYWDTNNTATATTQVPARMDISFWVSDPSGHGQPYQATLTGQRRQT